MNHDHGTFPGDHEVVTFVGRPFPLEEAPEHFSRLRRWGLTFSTSLHSLTFFRHGNTLLVRFLVTWEAVEHAGLYALESSLYHITNAILIVAYTIRNI